MFVPEQKEEKLAGGFLMTNEGLYVNYHLLSRIEIKYLNVKIKVRCVWDSDFKEKKYIFWLVFTHGQYLPEQGTETMPGREILFVVAASVKT